MSKMYKLALSILFSLTVMTSVTARADGAKTLPYAYGFENEDLAAEGWTTEDCGDESIIHWRGERRSGDCSFSFFSTYSSFSTQYLISPEIDSGGRDYTVSFYYELFSYLNVYSVQVGYSTTTNDLSAFSWEDKTLIEANDFKLYEKAIPAEVKYLAFKFHANGEGVTIFILDDIALYREGCRAPENLTVSEVSNHSARLTWTAPATTDKTLTGYACQYRKRNESEWSEEITTTATSISLYGLTADMDYEARVKAIYGGDTSTCISTRFTTIVAVPYEMGFEDGYGSWTLVDCADIALEEVTFPGGTGRRTQAAHDGNVGLQFSGFAPGKEKDQYLISPRFDDNVPIELSFYYRVPTNIAETIYVGYSTTTKDKDAFTFGSAITASSSSWTEYRDHFPAEARYFAVKYTSNRYYMYIDDFYFDKYSAYAKPTSIHLTALTETEAALTWEAPDGATGYAYQYRKKNDALWSSEVEVSGNSATLSGLAPNTNYDFHLKALYGSNASAFVTFSFQTEAHTVDMPYSDSFENGMGGWRMVNCVGATKITESSNSHSESHYFSFSDTDHPQYLISPRFTGETPVRASFWCENYSYQEGSTLHYFPTQFRIGYSTTTKDLEAFSWSEEIESTYQWKQYAVSLPVDTHYFAVEWTGGFHLFLDDFSFYSSEQAKTATQATFLGEEKYVTSFFNGVAAYQLPAGAVAYTAALDGDQLVFLRIGNGASDVIPAGTPVIIVTESEDLTVTALDSTTVSAREGNVLHASDTPTAVSEGKIGEQTVYVMGIVNGTLGFYPFTGTSIPAGKVYLLR